MNTQKLIAVIVGVAVVGAGAYFVLRGGGEPGTATGNIFDSLFGGETAPASEEKPTDTLGSFPAGGNGGLSAQAGTTLFEHEGYGLSFLLPEGFGATSFPEDESSETILVQKPGAREGFQAFVLQYDEPGPITAARILEDVPDILIDSPQQVLIGEGKKIQALIFSSNHPSLGKTREVWFVWPPDPSLYGNHLYQITAYADMDNFLGPILDTWRFK